MKHLILFLFILLVSLFQAQSRVKKEFIVLINGDTIRSVIKDISSYQVKVISTNKNNKECTRKIKADSIDILYSSLYEKYLEVHEFGKKKKEKKIIARVEEREIVIFCFLEEMMEPSGNNSSHNSGLKFFSDESYFRLASEQRFVLRKVNKEELNKIDSFKCLGLMQKYIHNLNEFDLASGVREANFKNLVLKYNNECEALKRAEEEERSNKK